MPEDLKEKLKHANKMLYACRVNRSKARQHGFNTNWGRLITHWRKRVLNYQNRMRKEAA